MILTANSKSSGFKQTDNWIKYSQIKKQAVTRSATIYKKKPASKNHIIQHRINPEKNVKAFAQHAPPAKHSCNYYIVDLRSLLENILLSSTQEKPEQISLRTAIPWVVSNLLCELKETHSPMIIKALLDQPEHAECFYESMERLSTYSELEHLSITVKKKKRAAKKNRYTELFHILSNQEVNTIREWVTPSIMSTAMEMVTSHIDNFFSPKQKQGFYSLAGTHDLQKPHIQWFKTVIENDISNLTKNIDLATQSQPDKSKKECIIAEIRLNAMLKVNRFLANYRGNIQLLDKDNSEKIINNTIILPAEPYNNTGVQLPAMTASKLHHAGLDPKFKVIIYPHNTVWLSECFQVQGGYIACIAYSVAKHNTDKYTASIFFRAQQTEDLWRSITSYIVIDSSSRHKMQGKTTLLQTDLQTSLNAVQKMMPPRQLQGALLKLSTASADQNNCIEPGLQVFFGVLPHSHKPSRAIYQQHN